MNKLLLILVTAISCYAQNWVVPPDTVYYSNQSRYIEVILPQPQLKAKIVSSGIKLSWDEYWTSEFINQYTAKFGYAPEPNRFSFYRNGDALTGVPFNDVEYVDTDVVEGETYVYKFLAGDLNYISIGGLQHWSLRSNPISISYNKKNPATDSNLDFQYSLIDGCVRMDWATLGISTSQQLTKSYQKDTIWVYDWFNFTDNRSTYFDCEIESGITYIYRINSFFGNKIAGQSVPVLISIPSNYLSIDDEYWDAVDDYENQKKIGWFGCQK